MYLGRTSKNLHFRQVRFDIINNLVRSLAFVECSVPKPHGHYGALQHNTNYFQQSRIVSFRQSVGIRGISGCKLMRHAFIPKVFSKLYVVFRIIRVYSLNQDVSKSLNPNMEFLEACAQIASRNVYFGH